VGDLAERWDLADEQTFIFKLRPNVKWHNVKPVNGRAFTSADVTYSFKRQTDLKLNAGLLTDVQTIEAVDPLTLKLTLKKPNADFVPTISDSRNIVVAREAVEGSATGDLKEGPTIGTGPWVLEKWDTDRLATLVRNPDFFLKGVPYADRVEFPVF